MESNSKQIIFHHPRAIEREGNSGSRVRPRQLVDAFCNLGFEVFEVTGESHHRAERLRLLQSRLKDGETFAFCYAENAPSPYALTDPDHFPRRPTLDHTFFKIVKSLKIPTGLFYRDIYWRFPTFKEEHPWWRRILCYPFYHYDLISIMRSSLDCLFLPSQRMATHFPRYFRCPPIHALPPGCVQQPLSDSKPFRGVGFYVGGILPPIYNLDPLFRVMAQLPEWKLNLVCREDEYQAAKDIYPWSERTNISVVHASGSRVAEMLREADLFLWLYEPDPYREFAMPVKIFEAMGASLPIITNQNDASGNFIARENIGWAAESVDGCVEIIRRLSNSPHLLAEKRQMVLKAQERHTWRRRAETVAQILSGTNQPNTCR